MSKSSNNNFEQDLYQIFKRYGYLFPTTEEEVERFERLHGTTDIEMPEKFKSSETIVSELKAGSGHSTENEIEKSYSMAARGGKKIDPGMISKMRSDRADSIAQTKPVKRKK
jgi:membrane carboxypeptidase/penicillin-binding protein